MIPAGNVRENETEAINDSKIKSSINSYIAMHMDMHRIVCLCNISQVTCLQSVLSEITNGSE